jgi:hypothetical protein
VIVEDDEESIVVVVDVASIFLKSCNDNDDGDDATNGMTDGMR